MRNSPWYILFLIAIISSLTGYVYFTSVVRTVTVTGKHIEEGHGRRGDTKEIFVIETSQGDLRILKFPIIGYSFGVDEVYSGVQVGSTIDVRVGAWPPDIISKYAKPYVLAIYQLENNKEEIADSKGKRPSLLRGLPLHKMNERTKWVLYC